MKNVTMQALVVFVVFFTMASCFVPYAIAKEERITITTYYPSPYGIYKEVRLFPQPSAPSTCDSSKKGTMYFNDVDNAINVCTSAGWMKLSGTGGPQIRSGVLITGYTNGQPHSSVAAVDWSSNKCKNPRVFLQSGISSIACGNGSGPTDCAHHAGLPSDLTTVHAHASASTSTDVFAVFQVQPTEDGFSAVLSTMDTVWVGASSPDYKIHWIALCDS